MLIKFSFKNFRSFKGQNEFSMLKGKQRFFENRITEVDNLNVLKFSAIFGANASGKSNLIRAIKTMQFIVLNNSVPADALGEYFKLDEDSAKSPTYFEMVFSIKDEVFSYGFEIRLDSRLVESEWLYKLHKNQNGTIHETMIFERSNGKISISKDGSNNPRLEVYKANVEMMPMKLFLPYVASLPWTVADARNSIFQALLKTYGWFRNSLRVLYTGEPLFSPELGTRIDEGNISKLLSYFDTGIKSITLVPSSDSEFSRSLANISIDLNALQLSLAAQQDQAPGSHPLFLMRTPTDFWVIGIRDNRLNFSRIEFFHDEQKEHPFKISNESDGTIRLFELADALLNQEEEKVIIVDELDRCLHPMLTVQFIKNFLEKVSRPNDRSQFIVTTHESRLMDLEILRRDEIWFTAKENNESSLYSLEEYNVRFDKVIDRAYFDGRYGGVPVFDSVFFPELVKHENQDE